MAFLSSENTVLASLNERVEKNLSVKIKRHVQQAIANDTLIQSDDFLALANLYHARQKYTQELSVLNAFLTHGRASEDDIPRVKQRYLATKTLVHEQRLSKADEPQAPSFSLDNDTTISSEPAQKSKSEQSSQTSTPTELSLVEMDTGEFTGLERVFKSRAKSFEKEKSSKTPKLTNIFNKSLTQPVDKIKVVALCAAYTGTASDDEIYELAMVSFDYCNNNDAILSITGEYQDTREPLKPINHLKLTTDRNRRNAKDLGHFDAHAIVQFMEGVDCVVSHNNPVWERQLFFCHFPALTHLSWRSSQLDIPWRALGYQSSALSKLLHSHQLSTTTQTSRDRAKGIVRLLAQVESGNHSSYASRLFQCQAMSHFVWDKTLRAQSKRLNKRGLSRLFG